MGNKSNYILHVLLGINSSNPSKMEYRVLQWKVCGVYAYWHMRCDFQLLISESLFPSCDQGAFEFLLLTASTKKMITAWVLMPCPTSLCVYICIRTHGTWKEIRNDICPRQRTRLHIPRPYGSLGTWTSFTIGADVVLLSAFCLPRVPLYVILNPNWDLCSLWVLAASWAEVAQSV